MRSGHAGVYSGSAVHHARSGPQMQTALAAGIGYVGGVVIQADRLAERMVAALAAREAVLRDEQAVYGLDALDEVGLHPVLASGLDDEQAGGFGGVFREWPYPWVGSGDGEIGEAVPKQSERERCDLVLTPSADLPPADGVVEARELARASGTLFESVAATMPGAAVAAGDETVWLEVKAVGQYTLRGGVAQANRAYATELVAGPLEDLFKLAQEPAIELGASVLVLFSESEEVARHDLARATHQILDGGGPTGAPVWRHTPMTERIGNAIASVAVFPLKR